MQCDDTRRQGLSEVIRIRWGYEGWALTGISALKRVKRELTSSLLFTVWGHSKKLAVCNLEENSCHNPILLAPWYETSSLQKWEINFYSL